MKKLDQIPGQLRGLALATAGLLLCSAAAVWAGAIFNPERTLLSHRPDPIH